MHIWAVLLAAGRSTRLAAHGLSVPKQFLHYQGAPLFWHSAKTFSRLPALRGIVFVFPPHEDEDTASPKTHAAWDELLRNLDAGHRLGLPWRIAEGGIRRQDSVAKGLAALPAECDAVLIHDSARPFASATLMTRIINALEQGQNAVIPGIAVNDTIKVVDEKEYVRLSPERAFLRAAQTPQGFHLAPLRRAHARAAKEAWDVTDDAALFERCELPVMVLPGEESNKKISTGQDLDLLRPLFPFAGLGGPAATDSRGRIPCSGFGYDVHRYGGNRPFILGGVPIRCDVLIAAHSDGDTLLHALMDALLGCIGGGDIGALFPDSDQAFDNISSGILLAEVLERCRLAGLIITHVDITVIAQTPRIAPHRQNIAANLAKLLGLPANAVNVKATTEEGLGFTGEKRGIKVTALVCGLKPLPENSSFCPTIPGEPL